MKTYEPADFVKAGKSSEGLPAPSAPPEVFAGMVDFSKSSEEELSFAPGTQCSFWWKKKIGELEKIEWDGYRHCDQNEYPYVYLHGEFTDEERVVFRALQAEPRPAPTQLPGARTSPTPLRGARPYPSPGSPPPDKPTPAPLPAARTYAASDGRTYYTAPTPRGLPGPDKGC